MGLKIKKEHKRLGKTPALFVYRDDLTVAAEKGSLLFFHGLTGSKEAQILELEDLASRGFLVVGLDAVGHGERRYPNFEQRFSDENPEAYNEFISIVTTTAQEVPQILDELARLQLLNRNIGIAGISLGGHIAYAAITLETRITVAATILGSPQWKIDLPESPHHHLERFSSIRLISQNAVQDDVVPAEYARRFHSRLKARYADYDDRFEYIEYPDSGHFMDEDDWRRCWAETLAWFDRYLTITPSIST